MNIFEYVECQGIYRYCDAKYDINDNKYYFK